MKKTYTIVKSPIADIRKEPSFFNFDGPKDPLQETQILYGEPVHVHEEKDGFCFVTVPDQLISSQNQGWIGYPGWLEKRHLLESSSPLDPNAVVTRKYAQILVKGGPSLFFSFGTKLQVIGKSSTKLQIKLLSN